MLPNKLALLKKQLESELYLDQEDKSALKILKVLDADSELNKKMSESDFLTKSFSVAPSMCPSCGKRL